jgi:hypothetical protein
LEKKGGGYLVGEIESCKVVLLQKRNGLAFELFGCFEKQF